MNMPANKTTIQASCFDSKQKGITNFFTYVAEHITNEDDFWKTLDDIFSCKASYIILYTRITKPEEFVYGIPTIQDRDILSCLSKYGDYKVMEIIEQKYKELSGASFIILKKVQ